MEAYTVRRYSKRTRANGMVRKSIVIFSTDDYIQACHRAELNANYWIQYERTAMTFLPWQDYIAGCLTEKYKEAIELARKYKQHGRRAKILNAARAFCKRAMTINTREYKVYRELWSTHE